MRRRWLLGVLAMAMAWMVLSTSVPRAQSNLVAAYAMNEGSGTSLADWTGKGHTGTLSGATWTPAGRFGGALSFDGVNDWVTVADAADLDLTTGLTLEAWVYPTVSCGGSWRNVLIKERPKGEIYGTQSAPLNAWSHLTVTFDNATLRIYVDGVQVGARAVAGPLLTSSGVLRIGGNKIWGEYFAGRIDNVRIYNRALSESQIQTDMSTPVQP
jgi:hypothetical protein